MAAEQYRMDADAELAVGDEKPWIEHRIVKVVVEGDKMRLSVGVDPRVKAYRSYNAMVEDERDVGKRERWIEGESCQICIKQKKQVRDPRQARMVYMRATCHSAGGQTRLPDKPTGDRPNQSRRRVGRKCDLRRGAVTDEMILQSRPAQRY
jgi:hypothetical protein